MQQYRVLVLTDHTHHNQHNSLYPLAVAMKQHPLCLQMDVATGKNPKNQSFFDAENGENIWVSPVNHDFTFSKEGKAFNNKITKKTTKAYDLIWLRLPPPLSPSFLAFLEKTFSQQCVINHPKGIYQSGSKAFLLNFATFCPPMRICYTKTDILSFTQQFPIVLKPFRSYGGKGIVRIAGNQAWLGQQKMPLTDFLASLPNTDLAYLGVKFLKNVSQGDKRIVVVHGKIMGASLRLPAKNSWLCNISMGGSSNLSSVTTEEREIIAALDPVLSKLGIVMYGVDTLVDDNGKRVLSEINTTSIGGLPQIAQQQGKPLVAESIDLFWQYFLENKKQ